MLNQTVKVKILYSKKKKKRARATHGPDSLHTWFILSLLLYVGVFPYGFSKNVSRPATVRIGAIFTFNSTIGRVAKIDRKSTRLNSSHNVASRMPSSA